MIKVYVVEETPMGYVSVIHVLLIIQTYRVFVLLTFTLTVNFEFDRFKWPMKVGLEVCRMSCT